MSAKTQQFQSSGSDLRSTIQQSINMIRGKDVSTYTLVFIDPTVKHQAGSHENIFMPHITLGRGPKCHVRFGDNYGTVSREHASISTDSNNVFLNHNPNAKNPTLVNGNAIHSAYSLQNGDEIQLSYDGPRIRFNTSKVKTSTIGLTSRIGGAISQAVKPYKTALTILGLLLFVAIGFAGFNMYQNIQLNKKLADSQLIIESLTTESQKTIAEIEKLEQRGQTSSPRYITLVNQRKEQTRQIQELKENPMSVVRYTPTKNTEGKVEYKYDKSIPIPETDEDMAKQVDNGKFRGEKSDEVVDNLNTEVVKYDNLPKNDVVFILGKRIEVSFGGKKEIIGVKEFYPFDQSNPQFEDRDGIIFGTGFFTDKGELITARHVVQPWRYAFVTDMGNPIWKELNILEENGAIITMFCNVLSMNGAEHAFSTGKISVDDSKDRIMGDNKEKFKLVALPAINKNFKNFDKLLNKYKAPEEKFSDWAKMTFDNVESSKISYSRPKSQKIKTATILHILSYSHANTLQSSRRKLEPVYSKCDVGQDYTFDNIIQVSGQNFGPGSSGGPAMIYENGKFIAIGIVTEAVGTSNAVIVPLQNVR